MQLKLQLYGLFKFANKGHYTESAKPSALDMVAHAKWTAWKDASTEGRNRSGAMLEYVEIIEHRYNPLKPHVSAFDFQAWTLTRLCN